MVAVSTSNEPVADAAAKSAVAMVLTKAKTKPVIEPPEPSMARLDQSTLRSAVAALLRDRASHRRATLAASGAPSSVLADKDELLPADDYLYLQVTWKLAPEKDHIRPRLIPLPHSLFDATSDEVCFFVRDPQRQVKDYLAACDSHPVSKVLGVSKLARRYSTAEARRDLHSQYDVFLADVRIAAMLPRLLGRHFIEGSNMPRPVRMDHNVLASVKRALASTPFRARQGTSTTVRIARLSFETEHIIENALAAVDGVVARIADQWDAVQSLSLKTAQSPALPIYVELPATRAVAESTETPSSSKKSAKVQASDDAEGDDDDTPLVHSRGAKEAHPKDGRVGIQKKITDKNVKRKGKAEVQAAAAGKGKNANGHPPAAGKKKAVAANRPFVRNASKAAGNTTAPEEQHSSQPMQPQLSKIEETQVVEDKKTPKSGKKKRKHNQKVEAPNNDITKATDETGDEEKTTALAVEPEATPGSGKKRKQAQSPGASIIQDVETDGGDTSEVNHAASTPKRITTPKSARKRREAANSTASLSTDVTKRSSGAIEAAPESTTASGQITPRSTRKRKQTKSTEALSEDIKNVPESAAGEDETKIAATLRKATPGSGKKRKLGVVSENARKGKDVSDQAAQEVVTPRSKRQRNTPKKKQTRGESVGGAANPSEPAATIPLKEKGKQNNTEAKMAKIEAGRSAGATEHGQAGLRGKSPGRPVKGKKNKSEKDLIKLEGSNSVSDGQVTGTLVTPKKEGKEDEVQGVTPRSQKGKKAKKKDRRSSMNGRDENVNKSNSHS